MEGTSSVPTTALAELPTVNLDVELNKRNGYKHPKIDPKNNIRGIQILPPAEDGTLRCHLWVAHLSRNSSRSNHEPHSGENDNKAEENFANANKEPVESSEPRESDAGGTKTSEIDLTAPRIATDKIYALSYTWGQATSHDDICIVQLNGQDFYVRRNLWSFLNRASQLPELLKVGFFIDAMSIDQTNPEEKMHQVGMMDLLYYSATDVIIWLGEPPTEDRLLHQGLELLASRKDWTLPDNESSGVFTESRKAESYALSAISQLAYWERTWIVQEVLLGKSLRVMFGGYEFLWSKIESLRPKLWMPHEFRAMDIENPEGGLVGWSQSYFLEGRAEFMDASPFLRIVEHKRNWVERPERHRRTITDACHMDHFRRLPAFEIMTSFGHQKCSDPRDKLYAMLGLMDTHMTSEVLADYEADVGHVYVITLAACLLSIVVSVQHPLQRVTAYLRIAIGLHTVFGIDEEQMILQRRKVLCDEYLDEFLAPGGSKEIRLYSSHQRVKFLDLISETAFEGFGCEQCKSHIPWLVSKLASVPSACGNKNDLEKVYQEWLDVCNGKDKDAPSFVHAESCTKPLEPLDQRFAYEEALLKPRNSSFQLAEYELLRTDDPINECSLAATKTHRTVTLRLPSDPPGRFQLGERMFSRHGSYLMETHHQLKETPEGSGTHQLRVNVQNRDLVEHGVQCSHCSLKILAVRYHCLESISAVLCFQCYTESKRSEQSTYYEPVYYPRTMPDWHIPPSISLRMNFSRHAYKFYESLLKSFANDPDFAAAIQGVPAGGFMFPWIPRIGVEPPYWVGNLSVDGKSANTGVPHIRCMGIRLKQSDAIDRPPEAPSPGYFYLGQALIEAVRQWREKIMKLFGHDALLITQQQFAKLSPAFFDQVRAGLSQAEQEQLDTGNASLAFPLDLELPKHVQDRLGESSRLLALEMPIGYLADVDAVFSLKPQAFPCDPESTAVVVRPFGVSGSFVPSERYLPVKPSTETYAPASQELDAPPESVITDASQTDASHHKMRLAQVNSNGGGLPSQTRYGSSTAIIDVLSHGPPVARLCHLSEPLVFLPAAIAFSIVSKDQGHCSDPKAGRWSWFEVAILRSGERQSPVVDLFDEERETVEQFATVLQAQGWGLVPFSKGKAPVVDENEPKKSSLVSAMLVVNNLTRSWEAHEVFWSRNDESAQNIDATSFMTRIQQGDRIAVFARAQFKGWRNTVQSVGLDLIPQEQTDEMETAVGVAAEDESEDEELRRAIALSMEPDSMTKDED